MQRRAGFVCAAALAAATLVFPTAYGHPGHPEDDGSVNSGVEVHDDHQHPGTGGHLPAGSENVDLISKLEVTQTEGGIADVGVFNGYAYLNAWEPECPNAGVHIVDINDPAAPERVGFIRAHKNSYPGEGIHVIHVDTSFFEGDVLLHNNEACDSTKPFDGGLSLWNVTDPTEPEPLKRGFGDFDRLDPRVQHPSPRASQSHSVFGWDAGNKAYAVIVDNEEATDVDIIDITKPTSPRMIAEFNLNTRYPQIVQEELGTAESFHHDVVVKQIGGHWFMLVSYWDGGYVVLNVDDPTNPSYVADNDFTDPDPEAAESGLAVTPEGNAHEAEFSKDSDFIVAADEDFGPYNVIAQITGEDKEFDATQGTDTPLIDADTSLAGDTVFVGQACPGDPAVPAAPTTTSGSQIAIVERGVCTFQEKFDLVEVAGGYEGVIIFNRQLSDGCNTLLIPIVEGEIPVLFVQRQTGFDFFDLEATYDDAACQAGTQPFPASVTLGTVGDHVDISAVFDGWGYVHLFTNNAGKLTELDTYAIPEAHDPAFAEGFGDLSVHEVAMSETVNDIAYFSYYSAGFRVARLEDDPADADTSPDLMEQGFYIDPGGNNFWGVQVFRHDGTEYVAASDRDFGLFIFEYMGPGTPNS